MKKILSVSLLWIFAQVAFVVNVSMAQESGIHFIKNAKSWKAILEQSAAEGKPIFVDVYTDWCPPCKWMDEHVFNQPEVGEFMNKEFINVKVDAEKKWGFNFAKRNKVTSYPTFLFFTPEGKLMITSIGGKPVDRFMNTAHTGLENTKHKATESTQK